MEWVSWAEAARITGVPVHRVEWWKRAKGVSIIAPRTRCDPRCGGLPSKSSVAGTTHAKPHAGSDAKRSVREGKPSERRPCRMVLDNGRGCSQGGPVQQDPDQTSQAARRRPTRPAVVDPRGGRDEIRRQLRRETVEAALDARSWVSLREAARIIGCDDSTVLTYVKRGVIERRSAPRNQPSLSRRSVDSFASRWRPRRGFRETQAAPISVDRCTTRGT